MSARLMLETNAVCALVRGDAPRLAQWIEEQAHCISVVTEAELRFGVERRPEKTRVARAVEAYLAQAEVLPWTRDAARRYAAVRTEMERHGKVLASLDLMIATHALAEHCTLVTADRRFAAVPALRLRDWTTGRPAH